MTETPDFEALNAELDALSDYNKIDGMNPGTVIEVLADALQFDAIDTLRQVRDLLLAEDQSPEEVMRHLDTHARLIWDLMTSTQSNPPRSAQDLTRMLEIGQILEDPEFR